MKREPSSFAKEIRKNMRGGDGEIIVEPVWKPGEEMFSHTRMYAKLTVNPGCSIGTHEHQGEEEIFYLVSGELELDDNGEKKIFKAGESAITRSGESHGVRNRGNIPAVILAVIGKY